MRAEAPTLLSRAAPLLICRRAPQACIALVASEVLCILSCAKLFQ